MKKLTMFVMAAAIIAVCSDLAWAELDIPASGTFDIVIDPPGTPGIRSHGRARSVSRQNA